MHHTLFYPEATRYYSDYHEKVQYLFERKLILSFQEDRRNLWRWISRIAS